MQNFARPFDAIARASPSTTWNVDSPNSACESLPKATRYLFKPYQIHLTQTNKQLACTPTTVSTEVSFFGCECFQHTIIEIPFHIYRIPNSSHISEESLTHHVE